MGKGAGAWVGFGKGSGAGGNFWQYWEEFLWAQVGLTLIVHPVSSLKVRTCKYNASLTNNKIMKECMGHIMQHMCM